MQDFYNKVDVIKEIEELIKYNSSKMLYIRHNTNTRCKCYDALYGTGTTSCKVCGGSGFVSSIELIEAFLNPVLKNIEGKIMTEVGEASIYDRIIYTTRNVRPKTGDRILIVGFDKDCIPISIEEVLNIKYSEEVRGYHGRVEFYKLYTSIQPQSLNREQKRLNSIPTKDKSKLVKGTKYKWVR